MMFHFYGNNNIYLVLKKDSEQVLPDLPYDHLFTISNSHLKCSVQCNELYFCVIVGNVPFLRADRQLISDFSGSTSYIGEKVGTMILFFHCD